MKLSYETITEKLDLIPDDQYILIKYNKDLLTKLLGASFSLFKEQVDQDRYLWMVQVDKDIYEAYQEINGPVDSLWDMLRDIIYFYKT
jgi:hypothetical protein